MKNAFEGLRMAYSNFLGLFLLYVFCGYAPDYRCFTKKLQKNLKNLLKKFANQKKSRTFVSGLRKQGSLDGISLLVISFSVINYVVSKSVRL